ncbi:integral membrane protein [Candidatus Regiella insecticola]|uniref:Integral membrane protein n=2 Tax=Candidatus Regiella insecticola TaxID=138073 RepID=A0A6L2ZMR6_9ENTR|nr:integral membrane protein [Candidatus Regiella insecticola]
MSARAKDLELKIKNMYIIYPLLAVIIWSANAVVSKMAAGVIDPAAISFYRWFLALVILTPFVFMSVIRNWPTIRKYWWKLMTLGLLGMVLFQSLAYYSAQSVSAVFIGIFSSVIPLLTVLISIIILRTAPTLGVVLGSILSLVGLVWLVSAGDPTQLLHQGVGSGEFMLLCASASYALYGVLIAHWAIKLPCWQLLYMQIVFGVLLLLPNFLLTTDIKLNTQNIPLVLYAAIPASIIAPYLWILGVTRLGANITAVLMNLTPVFTAIIVISFLNEKLMTYHLIGGSLTLAGVVLAQYLSKSSQ